MAVVTVVVDVIGAGWYPDPLEAGRRRYWDGAGWTARVSTAPGADAATDLGGVELAWTSGLAALAAPIPEPAPALDLRDVDIAEVATAPAALAVVTDAGFAAVDPIAAAFGAEARAPEPEAEVPSAMRRCLVTLAIAAAAVLVAGAAVAGAGILRSDEQRPEVLPEQVYRDGVAGFALRYPEEWRVLRRDRGDGIRFAIGAPDAPTTETNTVSVVVGTEAAQLPQLHTLADQLTETLRAQLPGVRLESAARTRLADAPGFRFAFRDPDATPPTRIEQYVGRTTSGRPLTVTVTIREPRTAPTARELSTFVRSLDPS